jgi:hypothetical protein
MKTLQLFTRIIKTEGITKVIKKCPTESFGSKT